MTDQINGRILEEIGQYITDILAEKGAEGAFMYAEAGDMWQEASIFKDLGNSVICRGPSRELFEAIHELWDAAEFEKKWAVLIYTISDGKFDAQFKFPEEIDQNESGFERREAAIIERFGDKPVDYSDF